MSVHEIENEHWSRGKVFVIRVSDDTPYRHYNKPLRNGTLVLRVGQPGMKGGRTSILKPTEALQIANALLAVSLDVLETEPK